MSVLNKTKTLSMNYIKGYLFVFTIIKVKYVHILPWTYLKILRPARGYDRRVNNVAARQQYLFNVHSGRRKFCLRNAQ